MKNLMTAVVAGIQYLVHPQILGSIQETIKPDVLLPVTLLTTDEIFGDLDGILQLFNEYDDVFNLDFGSILIEKPGGENDTSFLSLRDEDLSHQVFHLNAITGLRDDVETLPSGPYFLYGPNLHQAWRLYEDDLNAFVSGVLPEDVHIHNRFEAVSALSTDGSFKAVSVPSRLYHPRPSIRKPLSGIRISIGDASSLKGVHTTLSSRAWSSLYKSAAKETAAFVQKLLDMGAVVVGKTKTDPFTMGREWVDEQAPWSPRGDGYQRLEGASVGAAAALMGYEWLDQAVGDDIFVDQDGLYSLSPTVKESPLKGLINVSQYQNSRLFSRSLGGLLGLAETALNIEASDAQFPRRILYQDHHVGVNNGMNVLMEKFVMVLEDFLGIKAEGIDLQGVWEDNPPYDARGTDMDTYMKDILYDTFSYEYFHFFDDFRTQYHLKMGREPFAEATPQFIWNFGRNVTEAGYQAGLKRTNTFRSWFYENIMSLKTTPNTDAVMILPCEMPTPQYRDEPLSPPTSIEDITKGILATILQIPRLTVPFAQVSFHSRISGQKEYSPVCATILGADGTDAMMVQLVKQALSHAKWRTRVDTGRFAFPVNSSRNLDMDHGQHHVEPGLDTGNPPPDEL